MKIKNSILTLLIIFSVVPVAIFGAISVYQTNQKIETISEQNLEAVNAYQILSIQQFCDHCEEEMQTVGSYRMTQDAVLLSLGRVTSTVNPRQYVDNLLRQTKKNSSYVASISIVDKEFRVVGSSEEYTLSETSQFKYLDSIRHNGKFQLGNVYERKTDDGDKRLVAACCGVYWGAELVGYVIEELDTSYFDDLRSNMDLLNNGYFYLLDGNGEIITSGSSLNEENIALVADAQDIYLESTQEDGEGIKAIYEYDGREYITYHTKIENTGWGIWTSEDLTEQKNVARSYRTFMELIGFFLAAGVVCAQILATRKILTPMNKIMQTFSDIRRTQDYSLRIPVKSKDEMGVLAKEINGLIAFVEEENLQEKAKQRTLELLAKKDPLTDIKNKKAIERSILTMVQQAEEKQDYLVVGFVDIDDFREYNSKYGHQEGDAIIRFVADVLREEIPGEVGRTGGDEFVFCCSGVDAYFKITDIAERMMNRLNTEFEKETDKGAIPVPCSIGLAKNARSCYNYVELVHRADKAMYMAKDAGKNTYRLYENGGKE